MAKRVFTSFAIEDRGLRDLLVGQRLHTGTPSNGQICPRRSLGMSDGKLNAGAG
jgi:hypothetical protein